MSRLRFAAISEEIMDPEEREEAARKKVASAIEEGKASLDVFLGTRLFFYGVENNCFCVSGDGRYKVVFEAVEDESDGYRSMLEEVRVVSPEGKIFFATPLAEVVVRESDGSVSGWDLVDDGGHRWLRVGTDNADDYYPSFVFDYEPKKETGR